jgi:hypothetical protein
LPKTAEPLRASNVYVTGGSKSGSRGFVASVGFDTWILVESRFVHNGKILEV